MTYRVVIPDEVLAAIDAQVAYLVSAGAPYGRLSRWLAGLLECADSIGHMPRRFPVAEPVSLALGSEVRRVNFADYALYYRVHDDRREVVIVAFRHGRRRPWEDALRGPPSDE